MQYRTFGKTGLEISTLGFGGMRLPTIDVNGTKDYDTEESIRMMHRAMDLGVNFIDTAPGYCDTKSEIIVGKALKGRRDQVYLSTKQSVGSPDPDKYEANLEVSLKKLDTDYIDFYHFWSINLESFEKNINVPGGPLERAVKLKEQGLIRHISFSFHDKAENMIKIIDAGDGIFSSVLCQYNLLDRSNEEAIAYAHEKGLGVVIMGPVGGGRLGAPSPVIQELLPGKAKSSPEIALRFVLNNPGVNVALSGMSTMAQVEENCRIAAEMTPMTPDELQQVALAMEENKKLADLYCTGCNYCMPCPQNINIPELFKMMNYHRVYKLTEYARNQYAQIGVSPFMKYENAAACIDCGACEAKCPQHLEIREQLRQTHAELV